jgi:pimeloyl-ACP methyl ester carboxylesterase
MLRVSRFLHCYLRPAQVRWREEETVIRVGGEPREATLYLPRRARRPLPGWVVLHGLTVPGRHHAAMVRFVRALAASGAAVLVPDVPAWRELRIDTAAARKTIGDAARHLVSLPVTRPGGVVVTGFSFGATQALIAAADPSLHGILRSVVGFGGYADLGRMMRAAMTGEHEWKGVRETMDPDPYGRWVIFGNYLTRVPGYEHMQAVQDGALKLAYESGVSGTMSWDPEYDPLKARIRERLSPAEREVWDVVAPPAGQPPADLALAESLARGFAAAAREFDPGVDPAPALPKVRTPVILSHGVEDRLIPYTESLRLYELLSPVTPTSLTLTRLFAHSTHEGGGPVHYVREGWKFARLLHRALGSG